LLKTVGEAEATYPQSCPKPHIGAEALVRWQHPTWGFVSPGVFIPVFERNGFIFKLDQYMWEKTCQFLSESLAAGKKPLPVSVNVSRVDLFHSDVVQILINLVKKYDIPPRLLELEITESAYMDNAEQMIALVQSLKQAGFRILMDDFGSGYSSLNMLRDMPVDILKIDLHFLGSHDKSGRGGNILNSIVRMAKWLRMPVIAEGVETRQQADFLRTIGCNYAQGFYFSHPVPLEKYKELVANNVYLPSDEIAADGIDEEDIDELLNPNTQMNLLFNSVMGGIGLYELEDDKLTLLRANSGFQEMLGGNDGQLYMVKRPLMDCIDADDRAAFMSAVIKARDEHNVTTCHIHVQRGDSVLCLYARVSFITTEIGRQLFYLALEDITDMQWMEQEMRDLMDNVPGGFGIYEMKDDVLRMRLYTKWLHDINPVGNEKMMQESGSNMAAILPGKVLRVMCRNIKASYKEKCVKNVTYSFVENDGRCHRLNAAVNTPVCRNGVYRSYAFIYDTEAMAANDVIEDE
jgi:EAL domain-containing protein (putative c-di-GMP-specific phosphodiesterase class I)